jgi:nicotinamide phosphoribosyltransferase
LLQKLNRDTQSVAFKCCATKKDGVWEDVLKDPVTDTKKRSKAGKLALVKTGTEYKTVLEEEAGDQNLLIPVFRDGFLLVDQKFADIRELTK